MATTDSAAVNMAGEDKESRVSPVDNTSDVTEDPKAVEQATPVVPTEPPTSAASTTPTPAPEVTEVLEVKTALGPAVKLDVEADTAPPLRSPAPRRPKPPTKGILKPPPPPAKPTLSNRLRDIAAVVGGGAKSLFEPLGEYETPGAGPSTPQPSQTQPSVGGTLNALGGRLGLGLSRLVAASSSPGLSPATTPSMGSPLASRSMSLPEATGTGQSERSRQKQPLKRATFLLPSLSITYPISSHGEPWSQKVLDDRHRIETTHRSLLTTTTGAEYWTAQRLVNLYESACRGREEKARVGIVRALEVLAHPPKPRVIYIQLRQLDPSSSTTASAHLYTLDAPLNRHAAEALADVLTAEWGLAELKLENGVLDGDDALKPILHALLISGTLPTLSLAGNKRIKAGGWRLLAVFLKRARSLRYIDLSDTSWDRKGIDYLVQALTCSRIKPLPATPVSGEEDGLLIPVDEAPPSAALNSPGFSSYGSFMPPAPLLREEADEASTPAAVQSVRMDGCGLRGTVLESLAQGIRSSDVKNVSLRRNRISPLGAVALAIMIRDYPDSSSMGALAPTMTTGSTMQSSTSTINPDRSASPIPYAARRRPAQRPPQAEGGLGKSPLPAIPLVVSTPTTGVTSRILPEGYKPPPPPKNPLVMPTGGLDGISTGLSNTPVEGKLTQGDLGGASMALQRSVKALEGVERIGRLLTLDLKGNEIKHGVSYIAQVLKRNRTLKVLNLSDNRIDAQGLVALAEALKYNNTLETLDLSSNPCCGPSLEGVSALRTAFTVNTSLKRLFLSDTGLTNDGAIALAEFLPETKSLLHLDITSNPLVDTAGILAISVGLKSNTLIRCLDLSIPPNDAQLAELSQNILQACIRNTELAAASLKSGNGRAEGIWLPIKKSSLVRQVKEADQARAEKERVDMVTSVQGKAREFVYRLKPEQVVKSAEQTSDDLDKWFKAGKLASRLNGHHLAWEPGQLPKDDFAPLVERAKALLERLAIVLGETEPDGLAGLLELNDTLVSQVDLAKGFKPPPRLLLPSQIVQPETPQVNGVNNGGTRSFSRRHMRVPSLEISSPNFSIGDSDNDSDAEELDVGSLPPTPGAETLNPGIGLDVPTGSRSARGLSLDNLAPGAEHGELLTSPMEQVGKAWMEEEGEIFRKGTRLGVADEDEVEENGDVSGEQLKIEILETHVERSPTRRVLDGQEEIGDEDRSGAVPERSETDARDEE